MADRGAKPIDIPAEESNRLNWSTDYSILRNSKSQKTDPVRLSWQTRWQSLYCQNGRMEMLPFELVVAAKQTHHADIVAFRKWWKTKGKYFIEIPSILFWRNFSMTPMEAATSNGTGTEEGQNERSLQVGPISGLKTLMANFPSKTTFCAETLSISPRKIPFDRFGQLRWWFRSKWTNFAGNFVKLSDGKANFCRGFIPPITFTSLALPCCSTSSTGKRRILQSKSQTAQFKRMPWHFRQSYPMQKR